MSNTDQSKLLAGRKIAVPESRELNLFAGMLESRGAEVLRCPLVAIYDSPDKDRVENWLEHFVNDEFDDIILLTGEGLRRLLGFAERAGGTLKQDFIAQLGRVRKITRGPKPGNALRQIGLKSDLSGTQPTTEGIIEAMATDDLKDRKVAVQLYGSNPNKPLVSFLESRGAMVSTVAPYIYADDSEDSRVLDLLGQIQSGTLDAIAFTSTPQVTRLFQIAKRIGATDDIIKALNKLQVAAVGPVVAEDLRVRGITVKIMPKASFFMKPLVRSLVDTFNPSV